MATSLFADALPEPWHDRMECRLRKVIAGRLDWAAVALTDLDVNTNEGRSQRYLLARALNWSAIAIGTHRAAGIQHHRLRHSSCESHSRCEVRSAMQGPLVEVYRRVCSVLPLQYMAARADLGVLTKSVMSFAAGGVALLFVTVVCRTEDPRNEHTVSSP